MHCATARPHRPPSLPAAALLALLLPLAANGAEKAGPWNSRTADLPPSLFPPASSPSAYIWHAGQDIIQTPLNHPDVQVFPSANPQTEVSIAINTGNPLNLLITSNTTPTSTGQGYYYTTDGGVTWAGSDAFPNGQTNFGDPLALFDASSRAYDVTLESPGGICYSMSPDGGVTWGATVHCDPLNSGNDDKEHGMIDVSPGSPYLNRMYLAWTDFTGTARVNLTTSGDNFTARRTLDANMGSDLGQGVNIQTGPNGEVYVVYALYAGGFLPEAGMGFVRSLDGGTTFTPAANIFPVTGIRTGTGGLAAFNGTRVNSFPSMAVDRSTGPHRGRIYVTYADRSTGDSDIYCRHSDDQGATWSAAIRVNGDPVANGQQQWFPWASCDPVTGDLSVAYYNMDQPTGFLTKYYLAHSTDGGNTFECFPVADVSHTPTALPSPFAAGYAGDYYALTTWNGRAYPAWSDNRTGQYNVYFESVTYADPTDPNPPTALSAASDCTTPTSITVNWTDPTTLVDGTPLASFEIEISRNGTPVGPVAQGVRTFTDPGLVTGTLYTYDLMTKDLTTDSLSVVASISRYAGGDPTPGPPTGFAVAAVPGPSFQLDWTNPSTNRDGSTLCDFAGLNVYRNGALLTTLARVPGNAGAADTYTDGSPVAGLNCYKLTAFDSDSPSHESAFTAEICVEVPLQPPFCDQFTAAGPPDNAKWTTGGDNTGVVVDTLSLNPPSPPYAADFDGTDFLQSRPIDMTGKGGMGYTIVYSKEQTGGAESPDPNNDLILEFLNSAGTWDEISRHLGSDPDEVNFTTHIFNLDALVPSAGSYFHSQFRLRFRATGDAGAGFDNWFVDNVCLDIPSCGPTIAASPASISDLLVAGTGAGATVPVTVSNSCAFNALVWSAAANPPVSWLALADNAGTISGLGSQIFKATFNAVGLPVGHYTTDIEVSSNDPVRPVVIVQAVLDVTPAPVIGVAPATISNSVPAGSPAITDMVTISNTGAGPLQFNVVDASAGVTPFKGGFVGIQRADGRLDLFGARAAVARVPNPLKAAWYASPKGQTPGAALDRGGLDPLGTEPGDRHRFRDVAKGTGDSGDWGRHFSPQPFGQGGPDAAGYKWIDSDEAGGPTFSWVDITGVGTPTGVTGDDQNGGPFALGFPFSHYGNTYTSVRICSNGWLSFTAPSSVTLYNNTALPSASGPSDLIAPYWDDLNPSVGGVIYSYQDVANNRFIVEWAGVPHFSDTVPNWFEVILNKDGTIVAQYLNMAPPANSATVGVQNNGGLIGLQVAFNQPYVHDDLAVLMYQDASWLSASPGSGLINPGDSALLSVVSDPAGLLPGTYFGNVVIISNDPVTPVSRVHVTLDLTGTGVALPFCDQFNETSGVPDPALWTTGGVTLDGVGLNEPSAPTSARFNGTDMLTSVQIDMSAQAGTGKVLGYHWEETGGGDPPETGNDLILEFRNSNGIWDEVARHLGNSQTMQNYQLNLVPMDGVTPSSGTFFYPLFQFRFRATGDPGIDDWFVDDLCLQQPPCNPTIALNKTGVCDTLVAGTTGNARDVLVSNGCGFAVLSFSTNENPPVGWLDELPVSGTVSGAGNVAVSLTFNAVGLLPGLYSTQLQFLSNDPVNPVVVVNCCLKVTGAPVAIIMPDSLCVVGYQNGPLAHGAIQAADNGVVPLDYRLLDTRGIPASPSLAVNEKKMQLFADYANPVEAAVEPGVTVTDPEAKGYESPFRGGVQPYGQGGPDGFGYSWIDSDQPGGPPAEWTEIENNGGVNSGIACDDCNVGPFPLGFTFPYYGTNYNSVRICSNGWLSPTATVTAFSNACPFPSTTTPNNTIAPFWDDLDLRTRGRVYYRSDAALGRFIVEWKRVAKFGAAAGDTFTFQAILYKDGVVQYNYLAMHGVINSATIGIENAAGTTGLNVSCNQAYVHANLSVILKADQPWLSVTPLSGQVQPGGYHVLDLAMDPTAVPLGIHHGFVHIATNDPQLPIKIVPVCFDVREPPIAVALSRFEAVPVPEGIKITWETANETNHAYFDVLRSDSRDGSPVRVNPGPITGDGSYEFVDGAVTEGRTYWYRLEAVDKDGGREQFGPLSVYVEVRPGSFQLAQNHPNPFSSRTEFRLDLPSATTVSVRVYDATGRLVRSLVGSQAMNAGRYDMEWDGRDDAGQRAAAGFYFLKAETSSTSKTVRMLLTR